MTSYSRRYQAFVLVIQLWLWSSLPGTGASHPDREPSPDGERFLFVVDVSSSMERVKEASQSLIYDMLVSGVGGYIQDGDSYGVWTYEKRVYTGRFPMQVWSQRKAPQLGIVASAFLKDHTYANRSELKKVLPIVQKVVAGVSNVTVFIISDGSDKIKGTPFDETINSSYKELSSQRRRAKQPFITTLVARDGWFIKGFVIVPGQPLPLPERRANLLARQAGAGADPKTGLTPDDGVPPQEIEPSGPRVISATGVVMKASINRVSEAEAKLEPDIEPDTSVVDPVDPLQQVSSTPEAGPAPAQNAEITVTRTTVPATRTTASVAPASSVKSATTSNRSRRKLKQIITHSNRPPAAASGSAAVSGSKLSSASTSPAPSASSVALTAAAPAPAPVSSPAPAVAVAVAVTDPVESAKTAAREKSIPAAVVRAASSSASTAPVISKVATVTEVATGAAQQSFASVAENRSAGALEALLPAPLPVAARELNPERDPKSEPTMLGQALGVVHVERGWNGIFMIAFGALLLGATTFLFFVAFRRSRGGEHGSFITQSMGRG